MTRLKFIKTPLPTRISGDFLIEAMIGVLLMGIVGAGVTFVTSRVSVSQHDMAMQEIAIGKLRGMLLANGAGANICDFKQTALLYLPNEEVLRVNVSGCGANGIATVGDVEITSVQTPITLWVDSPRMGTIRVGGALAVQEG